MRPPPLPLLLAALLLAPGHARGAEGRLAGVRLALKPAFQGWRFQRPLFLTHAPGAGDRLFVVEQGGRVWTLAGPEAGERKLFLDLSGKTRASGEGGLLGLAFHPRYAENGLLFVYYSDFSAKAEGRDHQSVVARYRAAAPDRADPASAKEILRVDQPYWNHNGGWLGFGRDGYLYIALGDGGSGGDPRGNAQNRRNWLGSILRIDVNVPEVQEGAADPVDPRDDPTVARRHGQEMEEVLKEAGGLEAMRRPRAPTYAVPRDNPFVGQAGVRPEIWAYGLRNPWRCSFDRDSGDLWCGDVGQNAVEEVDVIVKGGNYGWNFFEGSARYHEGPPYDGRPVVAPAADYRQDVGGRSVTGGYVYRGFRFPDLQGVYLYGDFVSGYIRGLRWENGRAVEDRRLAATGKQISSFGEDAEGELYVTAFDGRVYRIIQAK